jgi:hypothetical protein
MIEIEKAKINRDPKAWLARHFDDLQPKRLPRSERAEEVAS